MSPRATKTPLRSHRRRHSLRPWEVRRGSAAAETFPPNQKYFLIAIQLLGLEPRRRRS